MPRPTDAYLAPTVQRSGETTEGAGALPLRDRVDSLNAGS